MFGSKKTRPGKRGRTVALPAVLQQGVKRSEREAEHSSPPTHRCAVKSTTKQASCPSVDLHCECRPHEPSNGYRPVGPSTTRQQRTQPPVEWVPRIVVTRLRMHGAMLPFFHGFSGTDAELSTETILTLWPWKWTLKQYHIIYVKCEYFTNQKR